MIVHVERKHLLSFPGWALDHEWMLKKLLVSPIHGGWNCISTLSLPFINIRTGCKL